MLENALKCSSKNIAYFSERCRSVCQSLSLYLPLSLLFLSLPPLLLDIISVPAFTACGHPFISSAVSLHRRFHRVISQA